MTDWSKIVSGVDLASAAKERAQKTEVMSKVKAADVPTFVNDKKKWEVKSWNKAKTLATLVKEKKFNVQFENRVWSVFYKMGFSHMNASNDFKVEMNGNSKQIDVFAMDDETCLLIECKSSLKFESTTNFKQELESINGYYKPVCDEIEKQYGPRKFKALFVTENYLITDESADMKRMDSFGIYYINDDTLSYYNQLSDILGASARYQLLGNLFKNEEIQGLQTEVPALRGVMGGTTYYSFMIEPEKLLKISYILHRNEANHLLMPTYQRLIKKERLAEIRDYVNKDENFFPNSLIVSFEATDDCFTPYDKQEEDKKITAGILRLPNRYRAAFVIDGQHRLYGYSESTKAPIDVVPVVAFANMEPSRQVSMFMDINEHQKSVSKALRNTLIIDLDWKSEDPKKRADALMLKVAESLGDEQPLYGRIVTGENNKTIKRCITTDYIKDAISATSFLNSYSKTGALIAHGTLDKDNNDASFDVLKDFLVLCFKDIAEFCGEEWDKGSNGFLTINNSTYALIRIFDDIANINLIKQGTTLITDIHAFHELCSPLLLDLCDVINEMSPDLREQIKKHKGGSAKKDSWKDYQVALNAKNPEFTNEELQYYIVNHCIDYNPEASDYLNAILNHIVAKFKDCLSSDSTWLMSRTPENFGAEIMAKVAAGNFKKKARNEDETLTEWDYLGFEEINKIAMYSSNWSSFASGILERPDVKNKTNTSIWLKDLGHYASKIKNGSHITLKEIEEIKAIAIDFNLIKTNESDY